MSRRLSWDEVSACIDRESVERYGRYLRGVVESETIFVKPAEPSLVNRMIVLGVVYDWCRRHHRRRHLPAIVRAFAWCAILLRFPSRFFRLQYRGKRRTRSARVDRERIVFVSFRACEACRRLSSRRA